MRLCAGCSSPLPVGAHGKQKWCSEKCRKAQYGGTCIDCGARTCGNDGRDNAPERCASCAWTRHTERNERIFTAYDLGERAKSIAAREGMTESGVLGLIDSHRRLRGEAISRHNRPRRELWPLIERRWREGATSGDIAREVGTTSHNVAWMVHNMRLAGIDLPRRQKRVAA